MQQQRKHSLNGPSSLRRRELCPASYWLEKDLPEQTSDAAEDGTQLHSCIERMLLADGEGAAAAVLSDFEDLTADQWEMIHWCMEQVKGLLWPGARILTEHYIDLKWFHPSIEGGTADLIIVEDFVKAIVVDFKFGFKPVPPASENLQLACYSIGAQHEFDVEAVEVCVIQPARELVDRSCTRIETIDRARMAASRSLNPASKPTPSDEACRYCKASGTCPAQLAIVKAPDALPTVDKASVELLPMSTISDFVAMWEDRGIESIVGVMKQRLLTACMTGYEDANWKLSRGRSPRVFTEGAEVEAKLRSICESRGKDASELYTQPKLKSVAQVEAVIGKSKAVKELFDPLVIKLEGNPKLERKNADAAN